MIMDKKSKISITIDPQSGFCPGVVRAISTAEKQLQTHETLYCLGDIVHNGQEVERLAKAGLVCIGQDEFGELHDTTVLLRAHGEPPSTYRTAKKNNITIIDATCSVVLQLQKKIKNAYAANPDAQIVIYGKIGHAEVVGLDGQCDNKAIIIESEEDLDKVDFNRAIILFSQTTKSIETFNRIVTRIKQSIPDTTSFTYHDTICRQVANRIPNIRQFAAHYDLILFIAGEKSSNGRILFDECRKINMNSHHISDVKEIRREWFKNVKTVGICGATSTPKWLMDNAADVIKNF